MLKTASKKPMKRMIDVKKIISNQSKTVGNKNGIIPDFSEKSYDFINPNHYKKNTKEVIEMMVDIHGKETTANYCEITAFKYRMRIGHKPNEPLDREMEKIRWYESKAVELRKN